MNKILTFIYDMLSGTGTVSSKRVSGIITLLISLGCIIYLTVNEGGTSVVENLIQTAMIIAASLLGISSVTSIWKGGKTNHIDRIKKKKES